jgi:hypothetical protein
MGPWFLIDTCSRPLHHLDKECLHSVDSCTVGCLKKTADWKISPSLLACQERNDTLFYTEAKTQAEKDGRFLPPSDVAPPPLCFIAPQRNASPVIGSLMKSLHDNRALDTLQLQTISMSNRKESELK